MAVKKNIKKKKVVKKVIKAKPILKRGDLVMVISGGHKRKRPIKGQIGKIKAIVGANRNRVIVEGLNLFVKHQKAQGPDKPAGKIQKERSLHISNVMYYVETLKRPVRLSYSILADGKKVRGYKDPQSDKFIQLER